MARSDGLSPVLVVILALASIMLGLGVCLAVREIAAVAPALAIFVLPSLILMANRLGDAADEWRRVWSATGAPGHAALAAVASWPVWGVALVALAYAIGEAAFLLPFFGAFGVIGTWLVVKLSVYVSAQSDAASQLAVADGPSQLATSIEAELEGASWRWSGGLELVTGRRGELEVTLVIGRDRGVIVQVRAPEPLPSLDVSAGPLAWTDPCLAELFDRLGARRVRSLGRLLEAHLDVTAPTAGEPLSLVLRGRVLRALDQLAVLARRSGPATPALEPTRGVAHCPFCRAGLAEAPSQPCGACGTPHHEECLAEGGGCTVLGCGWRPARARAPAQSAAEPNPGA